MTTFLIADDNPAKAMMLEAMGKKSGIDAEVIRAKTTDEAKGLIDTKKPSFAFIDYEMPTEDGPAVIAYLKEKVPSARIALVSSSNQEEYQKNAEKAGSEAYICTSFQSDEVEREIMDLLEDWKS